MLKRPFLKPHFASFSRDSERNYVTFFEKCSCSHKNKEAYWESFKHIEIRSVQYVCFMLLGEIESYNSNKYALSLCSYNFFTVTIFFSLSKYIVIQTFFVMFDFHNVLSTNFSVLRFFDLLGL